MRHTLSLLSFFLFLGVAASAACSPDPREQHNTDRSLAETRNEDAYNRAFCEQVGGKTEVRHDYTYPTGDSHVRVDCETEDTVYEGGLDKRSSLDSVQQALFFAALTGKQPAVVIYDTDGQVGRYEYRIRMACERAGVRFVTGP